MVKYLGVFAIVLGAIILFLSYCLELVDYNIVQFSALALILIGLVAHIFLTKRSK